MEISIKNFQIIKKARLTIEGVTAIVGDTNNGKTSIIRALNAVVFNVPGSSFIRKGAKRAEVEVTFPAAGDHGETTITWSKGSKGSATYNVDGEVFKKTGKSQLPIMESLGLQEVEIAREKWALLFWRQMEEPFLVFRSSGVVFEFFSSVQDAERKLVPVLRAMGDDEKTTRREAVSLEGAISALEESVKSRSEQVAFYEEAVVGLEPLVESIEKITVLKKGAEKTLESLEEITEGLREVESDVASLESGTGALSGVLLQASDASSVFASASSLQEDLTEVDDNLSSAEAVIEREDDLKSIRRLCESGIALFEFWNEARAIFGLWDRFDGEVSEASEGVEDVKKSISDLLASCDKCPVCGGEM